MLILWQSRRLVRWLGTGVCALACTQALAEPPAGSPGEPVQSIRPLLVAAIAHGQAQGILVGPAADAIAAQFASTAPIVVEVTTIASLATPGCKRLQVDTRQDQVADRERATAPGRPGRPLPPAPLRLQYRISFCADGRFPPDAAGPADGAAQPSGALR